MLLVAHFATFTTTSSGQSVIRAVGHVVVPTIWIQSEVPLVPIRASLGTPNSSDQGEWPPVFLPARAARAGARAATAVEVIDDWGASTRRACRARAPADATERGPTNREATMPRVAAVFAAVAAFAAAVLLCPWGQWVAALGAKEKIPHGARTDVTSELLRGVHISRRDNAMLMEFLELS